MADDDPAIGEVRTSGNETRKWDGTAWRLVPRTFLGGEDFTGRMREYAKPVLKTAASDLLPWNMVRAVTGLPDELRRTASGVSQAVLHPTEPVGDMGIVSDLGHLVRSAAEGDPQAMGHIVAIRATPPVLRGELKGTNAVAHAIEDNPAVRSGIGYTAGAGGALLTGVGHPFIGAAVGRMLSPLMKYPAGEIAGLTDRILGAGGDSAASGLTAAERAALKKQGYSDDVIDRIDAQARAGNTSGRNAAPRAEPAAAASPRPQSAEAPQQPGLVPIGSQQWSGGPGYRPPPSTITPQQPGLVRVGSQQWTGGPDTSVLEGEIVGEKTAPQIEATAPTRPALPPASLGNDEPFVPQATRLPQPKLKSTFGPDPAALTKAAEVPKLTAAEAKAGLQMVQEGVPPQQALGRLLALRGLQRITSGLPSDAEMAQSIVDRNDTGAWPR